MSRFTEKDIENMLSKTESTTPEFDKNVDFSDKSPIPVRRRSYRVMLAAACLSVIAVSASALFLLSNRGPDNESVYSQDQNSQFVSGVSLYPPSESSGFTNESYYFPEQSNGEMSTAGESSFSEDESSDTEVLLPPVTYPNSNSFYVGQGVEQSQTPEQYFAENPHEFLGGKLKLPVFARTLLTLDERKAVLERFSSTLEIDFDFDESLYNITGDCRGSSSNNRYSINAGRYGDWYFIAYTSNYLVVKADHTDGDAFIQTVKDYVAKNTLLFEQGEYEFSCTSNESRVYVTLKNNSKNGSIASSMPAYTFVFKMITSGKYSLASIEYECIGEILGEYETKLYGYALNEMFANSFYSEHGFVFGEEDTFQIVGHDVRYLEKNSESLVCPYYAFVVRLNPNSEESYLRTLFVPAIYTDPTKPDTQESK